MKYCKPYQDTIIVQVDVSEDEVIREASREKVLEMYGTSKIEAIPLSNQTDGRDPVQDQNGTEPSLLPQDSEPSSGRLFLPPTLKRSERHANPAVSDLLAISLLS